LLPNGDYFYESGDVQDMADKIYKGMTTRQGFLKDNSISQEWEVRSKDLYNWLVNIVI
jgi:hypothetical protein